MYGSVTVQFGKFTPVSFSSTCSHITGLFSTSTASTSTLGKSKSSLHLFFNILTHHSVPPRMSLSVKFGKFPLYPVFSMLTLCSLSFDRPVAITTNSWQVLLPSTLSSLCSHLAVCLSYWQLYHPLHLASLSFLNSRSACSHTTGSLAQHRYLGYHIHLASL